MDFEDQCPENKMTKRNRILIELDVQGARDLIGLDIATLSDEGIIWGLHKTRLHVLSVPLELRRASLQLLRQNGFNDLHGQPLPDRIEE